MAWGGDTDNPATARAVAVSTGGQLYSRVAPDIFTRLLDLQWSMRYTSGSGGWVDFFTTGRTGSGDAWWSPDGTIEVEEVTGRFTTTTRISVH